MGPLHTFFSVFPFLSIKKERKEGGRKKGRKERKRERKKRRKGEREKGRKEGRKEGRKKVKLLGGVQFFVTLWTVARQAPLSMGFSRQEYWSGLPFPSPGDLPNPGIKPRSPMLQADALSSEPPGSAPNLHLHPILCISQQTNKKHIALMSITTFE